MRLTGRVERLERATGAGLCPCHQPRLIEIVEETDEPEDGGGPCERCGRPLPVSLIVAVRPEGVSANVA